MTARRVRRIDKFACKLWWFWCIWPVGTFVGLCNHLTQGQNGFVAECSCWTLDLTASGKYCFRAVSSGNRLSHVVSFWIKRTKNKRCCKVLMILKTWWIVIWQTVNICNKYLIQFQLFTFEYTSNLDLFLRSGILPTERFVSLLLNLPEWKYLFLLRFVFALLVFSSRCQICCSFLQYGLNFNRKCFKSF